ncbi:methionine--tRNA ligase [Mycoplasmopsis gallinacea]|uniref:Methionine--tRNA ligase n=1 Tax=Mycoplasmopsis gallinacea TaxID=29556 RepID=A0A6H0V2W9_9BACT|nr:methionine--tRNA ligase [Mycoplasmopsis gallinacea]QIW62328.1 methionine--tRNA ligase [Mycoplasmopsis gallinacea]
MKKTFYITTPIYYASGNLHIGHLYTTTVAWVIANYKKALGYDVKMLTGSDEHGQKIAQKAAESKMDPQSFVDNLVVKYHQLWKDYQIDFDIFSRTTNPKHKDSVSKIFEFFKEKGFIYKGEYQGLYSVSDEEFVLETQAVKKDGKLFHPLSGHELVLVSEKTYFFKMSLFTDWLINYIKEHPNFLAPLKTVNEIENNFLNKGVEDLSVTRTNVSWGIPVSSDPEHTLYVWLDALCNYITMLGYDPTNPSGSEEFNKYWASENAEVVHILGKEIARFHMIYWPIFLKGLNLKMPTRIQSHGWIVTPTGKMSKSKGNVIDPYDLLESFHPEMVKYYLVAHMSLGEDGIFDLEHFVDVINSELINNYGNLISRTIKMYRNSFDSPIKYNVSNLEIDQKIEESIKNSKVEFISLFDEYKIDKALKVAINLSSELNKYIDETAPWTLKENLPRLEQVLIRLLNGIYAISSYLQVVLKSKAQEVSKVLNIDSFDMDKIDDFHKFDNVLPEDSYILFKRIVKK